MTALSFGLIASILRTVSSITSRGVICLVLMSSAKPRASYDERSAAGAAACVAPGTKLAITWPIPVRAKLDDDILSSSRRLIATGAFLKKTALRHAHDTPSDRRVHIHDFDQQLFDYVIMRVYALVKAHVSSDSPEPRHSAVSGVTQQLGGGE